MAAKAKTSTQPKNGMSALSSDELGSAAQRDRRRRIIDATLALASKGGYDAVQMRAVAEKADVALGTLYRYFPSKIHLLVSGLAREFERAHEKLQRTSIPGDTPSERLIFVLSRNTRLMQRDPHLTEAMVRAFMFADTTAAAEVEQVGRLLESMFARAMGIEEPTEHDRAVFHLIADVWMANLVAWVTRRASAADVANRLELSVHLLLDNNTR
ncbi:MULTISPECIES: cholesterol catabolism transcriptional regulator KstR [Amycolatopsis]|uniref:Cholesterol catabolism transcriptional regulator KstR n=1 Tax=Amycolatopsis tucumanensis TaxID=401106 RepID=A0ABP7IHG0_9PSEU|nr:MULTISPECIES: cholesterol catabolism transcriptional regulator KstR [Amycolatopsis]MCF6425699.1 cholesterol catabolism transcriptional regulator KstR [Amycolatopsis tucumanensis]